MKYLWTALLLSCAAMAQYDVPQAGYCVEPPEEHVFAWDGGAAQTIYRYGCVYENTGGKEACCDYIASYGGSACMHRFCTVDCHEWTYLGSDCQ